MHKHQWDKIMVLGLLLFCSCLVLFTPKMFGQASSIGAILGTVTDATGATIPGAEVTATHIATQVSEDYYDQYRRFLHSRGPRRSAFIESQRAKQDSKPMWPKVSRWTPDYALDIT